MLHLAAVRTTFEVLGSHAKKPGTTVDITFWNREGGRVMASRLNAGYQTAWAPGEHVRFPLTVTETVLDVKELQETCIRLSWFPDQDESMQFNLRAVVTFEDGTEVRRLFLNNKVGSSQEAREQRLGLLSACFTPERSSEILRFSEP